jgi:hypothetical protein
MLSSALISVPSRRLTWSSRRGWRTTWLLESRKDCRAFLSGPLPVRPAHQFERVLAERFIAPPAQENFRPAYSSPG